MDALARTSSCHCALLRRGIYNLHDTTVGMRLQTAAQVGREVEEKRLPGAATETNNTLLLIPLISLFLWLSPDYSAKSAAAHGAV